MSKLALKKTALASFSTFTLVAFAAGSIAFAQPVASPQLNVIDNPAATTEHLEQSVEDVPQVQSSTAAAPKSSATTPAAAASTAATTQNGQITPEDPAPVACTGSIPESCTYPPADETLKPLPEESACTNSIPAHCW